MCFDARNACGSGFDYDIVEHLQEFEYERDAEDAIRALDG